jgi:hypothetical protein
MQRSDLNTGSNVVGQGVVVVTLVVQWVSNYVIISPLYQNPVNVG